MNTYALAAVILVLAVCLAYLNHRFIRIANTVAIMIGSLIISIVMIILQHTGAKDFAQHFSSLIAKTNFNTLLLDGMLSFFLFAGSMNINLSILRNVKTEVITLASLSTIASALLIGYITYYLLPLLGLQTKIPLLYCLMFGALISPTDPIATLATFKKINAPKKLDTIVSGEALFNDGVGIVIFLTIYELAFTHTAVTVGNVFALLGERAIGGLAYGAVLGFFMIWVLKPCRDANLIVLVTIALVAGGYALAQDIHISGPLAMVVSGIIVGNGIHKVCSELSCKILTAFWEIIDELLNAVLFLLIGFEMLEVQATTHQIYAILCAIPIVLVVRFITVATPVTILKWFKPQLPHTIRMLTWGGLRGGLAIALALSLPDSPYRHFISAMTYGVVAFSIIIQGLSIGSMARKAKAAVLAAEKGA